MFLCFLTTYSVSSSMLTIAEGPTVLLADEDKQIVVSSYNEICSHKKDEVLTYTTTYMNLQNIMPGERGQSLKTHVLIPFVWNIQER